MIAAILELIFLINVLQVLILRNHGVVACGESIEEALFLMQNVVLACETQIKLMSCGVENIQIMSDEAIEQVRSIIKAAGSQVQGKPGGDDSAIVSATGEHDDRPNENKEKLKKWKVWDLEFEAHMRMLDNAVSIDRCELCLYLLLID